MRRPTRGLHPPPLLAIPPPPQFTLLLPTSTRLLTSSAASISTRSEMRVLSISRLASFGHARSSGSMPASPMFSHELMPRCDRCSREGERIRACSVAFVSSSSSSRSRCVRLARVGSSRVRLLSVTPQHFESCRPCRFGT